MAAFYYLVSSLPMLFHAEVPLMPSNEFLAACADFLSDIEMKELNELSLIPPEDYSETSNSAAVAWYAWEVCLRNALVNLRTKGKNAEGENFLREEADFFSEIDKGTLEAFNKSTPLETENALDKLRWTKLDDMEVGHTFDFFTLCVYKLRLMLCEKQTLLNKEEGSVNFDKIVEDIYKKSQIHPMQIKA